MSRVLDRLAGGDRRSIGRVDEVIADVDRNPDLFPELFEAMLHDDPLVRMRAADAAEKITKDHPELLRPYKRRLLDEVAVIEQQEIRWHVAQMIPRLDLNRAERIEVFELLFGYLRDRSSIVRALSMQAIADLAMEDESLRSEAIEIIEECTHIGTPAMKSRGRKLLAKLGTHH